jgi:hypothetical protein
MIRLNYKFLARIAFIGILVVIIVLLLPSGSETLNIQEDNVIKPIVLKPKVRTPNVDVAEEIEHHKGGKIATKPSKVNVKPNTDIKLQPLPFDPSEKLSIVEKRENGKPDEKVIPERFEGKIPVVILGCSRTTITRAIDSVLKYRPKGYDLPIYVSLDCGNQLVHEAVQTYSDKLVIWKVNDFIKG